MANDDSLIPILVEDDEIIIKTNSLRYCSFLNDDQFQGFFKKEPLICVIFHLHEWYTDIYNYLKYEKIPNLC